MSMSTSVSGFRPPDEKWKKMKAIWDSCEKADIAVPDEVENFFDGGPPDDLGVEIDLEHLDCCNPYGSDDGGGFEVKISKLPKDIKIIRFCNSW